MRFHRVAKYFPAWVPGLGTRLGDGWALLSLLSLVAFARSRSSADPAGTQCRARVIFCEPRRVALLGAPAAAIGYGVFVER